MSTHYCVPVSVNVHEHVTAYVAVDLGLAFQYGFVPAASFIPTGSLSESGPIGWTAL